MDFVDKLLNKDKIIEQYKDYLLELFINDYGKCYEGLIKERFANTVFLFESDPITTYNALVKEGIDPKKVKSLFKFYLEYKEFQVKLKMGRKLYSSFVYRDISYLTGLEKDKVKKLFSLTPELFSSRTNQLLDNLPLGDLKNKIERLRENYLLECDTLDIEPVIDPLIIDMIVERKNCVDICAFWRTIDKTHYGKKLIRKIKKLAYLKNNISSYTLVDLLRSPGGTVSFMDSSKKILNVSLGTLYSLAGIDQCLLHELVHSVERSSKIFEMDDLDKLKMINEFKTQRKALLLYSKMRSDGVYIFDEASIASTFNCMYDDFIPYVDNFISFHEDLINYCSITNKLKPLYNLFGKDNFLDYATTLNKIYDDVITLRRLSGMDVTIDRSLVDAKVKKMDSFYKKKMGH